MPTESDLMAHLRIAVAMRAVRGALGVNQAEFAKLIGVSKPTVARVETLEAGMRLDTYSNMLKKLKEIGVVVDTLYSENVLVEFEPKAIEHLKEKLADQGQRRKDRTHEGITLSGDSKRKLGELGKSLKDTEKASPQSGSEKDKP